MHVDYRPDILKCHSAAVPLVFLVHPSSTVKRAVPVEGACQDVVSGHDSPSGPVKLSYLLQLHILS